MLSAYVTSAIRTGVPVLVGWLVSWLVAKGIGITPETRDWFVAFLTFACTMGYYLIVRFLEQKNPKIGWLLGVPAKPVYPGLGEPVPAAEVEPAVEAETIEEPVVEEGEPVNHRPSPYPHGRHEAAEDPPA